MLNLERYLHYNTDAPQPRHVIRQALHISVYCLFCTAVLAIFYPVLSFFVFGIVLFWCMLFFILINIRTISRARAARFFSVCCFQGIALLVSGIVVALFFLDTRSLVPVMAGFTLSFVVLLYSVVRVLFFR